MPESDYSHSMVILVALNLNSQGTVLESAGVGLIIHQCKAPIGQLANISLIKYGHSLLEAEGQSSEPECGTFCTIIGNYGGHMAFAMDPQFCVAYPLDVVLKGDPGKIQAGM